MPAPAATTNEGEAMTKKIRLSDRETLFCGYYVELGSGFEAARRAGYKKSAENATVRLLAREDIQQEILRQRARRHYAKAALSGLARLAFGSVNDAVRLTCAEGELPEEEIAELDLFAVSELKKTKGGGCEVKLCDRQKALALLLELGSPEADGENPLLAALDRGVRAAAALPDEHAL